MLMQLFCRFCPACPTPLACSTLPLVTVEENRRTGLKSPLVFFCHIVLLIREDPFTLVDANLNFYQGLELECCKVLTSQC